MATRRHQCVKNPGDFSYIYGYFTLIYQRRNMKSFVKRAYKAYFRLTLGDQDKKWAPYIVCHNYEKILCEWTKGKHEGLFFRIPITCRKRKTAQLTAIFVWSIRKAFARKRDIKSFILVSHQQLDLLFDYQPVPVFTELSPSEEKNIDEM